MMRAAYPMAAGHRRTASGHGDRHRAWTGTAAHARSQTGRADRNRSPWTRSSDRRGRRPPFRHPDVGARQGRERPEGLLGGPEAGHPEQGEVFAAMLADHVLQDLLEPAQFRLASAPARPGAARPLSCVRVSRVPRRSPPPRSVCGRPRMPRWRRPIPASRVHGRRPDRCPVARRSNAGCRSRS